MGVLGLTPFLQKTCPQVVRSLPNRFSDFSGKTIVIDGTLITQRFHFAALPQQYRHVLCWFRLAMQLRQNDIQAICVFDGKERSLAKEREIERRRRDRLVTAARGRFEHDRLSRLRRLSKSLHDQGAVDPEQSKVLQLTIGDVVVPVGPAALIPTPVRKTIPHPHEVPISYDSSERSETKETIEVLQNDASVESPSAGLMQLYAEYRQSIPQLASLPEPPSPSDTSVAMPAQVKEAETTGYVMSKNQHELMVEEGKLWGLLAESAASDEMPNEAAELAETLEAKSTVLWDSYMRRVLAPTRQTYEESQEILRVMGIPCIETSGRYEGEALAASLVVNGHADYVASEDTDVLIYDAPLIRNFGSSSGPLVLISGAEVRTVLDLDRASFIDFALLLGTDFSQRIKNVGPTRALKFIREHGSIERVLEQETQYPPRVPVEEYIQQVQLARQVFGTLPPPPDATQLEPGIFDEAEVMGVLDKFDLRRYATEDWDYSQALSGNFFADNPSAT